MTWQDSVLALIEAADPSSVAYDAAVPDTPALRYAVLYADDGTRTSGNAAGDAADGTFRFQVTTVASNNPAAPGNLGKQCRWLSTRIRDALVGAVPADDQWVCGPIEQTLTLPIRSDDSLPDRTAVISVQQFELLADRITT